jgi:hypothetical protein
VLIWNSAACLWWKHFRAHRHGLDAFHVRLKPDARAVKDMNAPLGVDFDFGINDVADENNGRLAETSPGRQKFCKVDIAML